MDKNNLQQIINDLRSRRDALSLCHEHLKHDSDQWNKLIIFLSLSTGLFESFKLQMGLNNAFVSLVPIVLSSVIASVSALIKFKNYPAQMEIILQSQALLTNTLTTARNETEITPQLLKLYNDSLEKLEVSIYPDIRRKFLKDSHNNLISIMKLEQKYFNTIEMMNNNPLSNDITINSDSSIESSKDNSLKDAYAASGYNNNIDEI
jgi:hypothetical protein